MERRDFWGMRFWNFEPRRREGAKDGVLCGVLAGWVRAEGALPREVLLFGEIDVEAEESSWVGGVEGGFEGDFFEGARLSELRFAVGNGVAFIEPRVQTTREFELSLDVDEVATLGVVGSEEGVCAISFNSYR